jgi:outer membrane protein W
MTPPCPIKLIHNEKSYKKKLKKALLSFFLFKDYNFLSGRENDSEAEMNTRVIWIKGAMLIGLSFLCVFCLPQKVLAQKFQFSVFGGVNHVFSYGSEEDYVFGENDFPVMPSHTPGSFGASLALFFTKNIGLELDGRYTLSSQVSLRDPSDEDTVDIDASKHYTITLNVRYRFLEGKIRPYLCVGGGVDKLLAEDRTYVSEYGWEVELLAPEKTVDPVANLGVGVHYLFRPNFGIRFDLRYVLIFSDPDKLNSLNGTLGVSIGF